MPALFTTTSIRPKRSSVKATSRSRSASTLTSHVHVASPSTSAARRSSRSARRAAPTTWAPAADRTRAKRSPSPLEAPVTMATRPSSPKISAGPVTSCATGLDTLDQHAGAEAAATAHGHQGHLAVRPLELVHRLGDEHGAGRAEGMAECDRTAVRVHALHVRLELALPRQ